jgi:hypothetical protein
MASPSPNAVDARENVVLAVDAGDRDIDVASDSDAGCTLEAVGEGEDSRLGVGLGCPLLEQADTTTRTKPAAHGDRRRISDTRQRLVRVEREP